MNSDNQFLDENLQHQRAFLILGGVFTFIAVLLTISDIFIGSFIGVDLTLLPKTAIERFQEFETNKWLGLYHLDFLNTIIAIITIPSFYALFIIHYHVNRTFSSFAFSFFIIGTILFIGTNVALPMLDLSEKFAKTSDPQQKMMFAAAGEALLARGTHGSLGVFWGFFMTLVSNILISIIMLNEKIFSKISSLFGLIGSSLLMFYVLIVTFIPQTQNLAMVFAAPGGILVIIWMMMYGIKLFKLLNYSIMRIDR